MVDKRRILHIDLDAFFCAVEELRDPKLKGKPFAVGGRPDQRGVVASCSYAARKFGVHSAMPMAQAVKICPELITVRGHYSDYGDASRKVIEHLRSLTEQIEQISIDEAFMDITKLLGSSQQIAENLQDHINSEISLPCSIGIAANKLVAKMATNYGKVAKGFSDNPPNAVFIIPAGQEEKFLAPLPVDALWGVGPKTAEKLHDMQITTIGDLARVPESEVSKRFGKWGYALIKHARGIDDRPIVLKHVAKSVSQKTTFAEDIREEDKLLDTISKLTERISKRLKKKHSQGTTVRIKLRRSDFSTITRQVTLHQPTNNSEVISERAIELFRKEWKTGESIRLIGVGVSGLAPEQLSLWDQPGTIEKDESADRLESVIRDLQEKYGEEVLKWGEDLPKPNAT
jgi:DNA polymerase-4